MHSIASMLSGLREPTHVHILHVPFAVHIIVVYSEHVSVNEGLRPRWANPQLQNVGVVNSHKSELPCPETHFK